MRIANSINREKTLYDIFPIKMVERSGTSDSTATKKSIHQNGDSVKPDAKKSKADADFESFDAEDFFHVAAARSVSEVVGESEKSANAPEAPRAAKKRGLSDRGLVRSNLVVADMAGEDNGAVFGSTIVLNRKQLSKEDGWARTLIYEVEHLTEGTKEWDELARYLLASGNSDPAFDAVARNYFKGDETVGESALAKFQEGTAFSELTEQEQLFLTELIAHETEVLFGSERMLKRIAKEKRSLAKRLLERIEDFFRILKMSKEERKNFVKLEQARACLEKALLAAGDAKTENSAKKSSEKTVPLDQRTFGYDELVSKGDLTGIVIDKEKQVKIENGVVDKAWVAKEVKKKCENLNTQGGPVYYANAPDIGRNVEITNDGIYHGFAKANDIKNGKSTPRAIINARVALEIPQLLRNSIEVNRSQRGNNIDIPYTHVMMGTVALESDDGVLEYYAVRSMVMERANQNPILIEANVLGKLHAVNAKKIDSPNARVAKNSVALTYGRVYMYSIADFLEDVNTVFDDTFSKDVYNHFGKQRRENKFSANLQYSKADAEFESFDAEDFFREAAARSVSEVVGESEKSTKSPEAPLAPKKRGLSEGQAKKLEANYVNHKTFSRKEVAEVVDSITRKHLDFGEDYGVLIGKGRQEAIDALFVYLNTPGADHQLRAGEKIADLILENAIVKNIYEGLENEDAAQVVSALRPYLKRIDLESIKGDVEQKYGKDRSPFLRWGKTKRTADPVSADMVAKELEGLGIELHADRGSGNDADLFIAINEAYLSSMERLNTATRSKLKEVLSTDEGQSLKKQIVSDVQEALQSRGTVSKVQRAFESALKKATESSVFWKKEHEQQKKWTSAYNTLKDAVEKFDEVVSGKYGNVTAFKDERFKGSVGLLSKLIFRGNINVSGTRKTVGQILSWYTDENNKLIRENHLFEKDVEDKLRAIAEGEGTLKAEELKELTKVVGYFKNFVQNYDKVWRNGRFEDAGSSAKEMVKIIEENRKYSVGWVMMLSGSDYAQMYADPMSVARRADMYNEKGFFTTMLTELKRGGIDAAVHEMDLQAGIREFEKSHKSYFKQAQTQTVEYHGGAIPKMVAIGLYMSYKRQQAQAGLLFNGFSYKDEKGVRVRRGGVLRADQEYSEGEMKVQIREEQRLLESAFSDADKAYIKALEEGYEKAKELKRSEDLLRLGYTNALEGYYYPIRRANKAQDLDSSDLADEFGRVNSASFNQNTVKGAKQELFLEPANAVFDRHAKAVALYRGIGHVLDTYNVLLNYDVGDNPNKPKSVATESSGLLREKKGSSDPNTAAVRYIKDLVSDLQGGRKQSGGLYSILRSKYAVAVLGLNPKSWMSQLSSLIVSASILDPSSIAQGFTADTKDVDKYCRLAEYRNADSTAVKAQGLIEGALDQTGQALMTPIGKMDRLVVCKLFGACQVQVAKDQKLKLGSEENKIAAGQLLEKVIMETQQGSIVTEKSAAMRSGSELQKTLTMFKSDIMKVSSRVVDSFGELVVLKKKLKDAPADQKKTLEGQIKTAKTNCFKAMGSMTASAIYLAAIAQAFRWIFRQDDEEEDKLQGFLLDCFGNMIGGLPFISEAYGFFTNGYEVNSFAYTLINDVLEAGKSLGDLASDVAEGKADGKDMARTIKKLVLSMSQLAGIPAKNAYKLINGPVMRALEVASPGTVYKWDSLFFNQSYRKDLAKAVENEDEEMIATIAGLIMDESIGAVEDDTLRHTMNGLLLAGHDVLPQSVPGQISYDGVTYQLDGKQQRTFRSIYGAAEESATALVKMRGFSKETPETQAKALNFIYTTYYNLAKQEVLGVDLESKNVLFAEAIDVEILAMVICHCRSITADTDRSGKTVAGSKKAKIQTYVNSLGLSAAQKYMIMGYLGYTNKYGKGQVQAYINRLSLSREEKAELLEKSGYPEG